MPHHVEASVKQLYPLRIELFDEKVLSHEKLSHKLRDLESQVFKSTAPDFHDLTFWKDPEEID